MGTALRVLIVEDSEDDAILVLRELRRAGYDLTSERVDTPEAMNAALEQQTWDIVLSDYAMPRFSMPAALAMVKERGLDLPFIIVSGAIGEEAAVAAMRAGAHDYVMKDDLARLAPAVERELREAEMRYERKQMEQALRESEEHYSALVGNLTDAVFHFKGGVITWCNDRVEEIYGYPKDELLGKSASFFYPSDISPSEFTTRVAAGMKERGFFRSISKFQKKDGSFVYLDYSLSQIPGKDPIEVVAVARDITERRRMEEALRQSEAHYRLLADNATDVIWTVDLNMRLTYISPAVTYLLGYSVEEAIGKSMEEVFTPASFEVAMKVLAEELAVENTKHKNLARSRTLQFQLNRKDGSVVPVELNCTFLRESDGHPAEVLVIARDITERKRAEEALRESEERLRAFIENAPDGITAYEFDGTIIDTNKKAEELLGLSREEMVGKSMFELGVIPEDYVPRTTKALAKGTDGVEARPFEFELMRKDGSRISIEATTLAAKRRGKLEVICIVRDITERKKAEEALRQREQDYSVLLESTYDGIAVVDAETLKLVFGNRRAARMFGFDPVLDDGFGLNVLEFVHPEDKEIAIRAFTEDLYQQERRQTYELRAKTKDGREIWVSALGTRIEFQGRLAVLLSMVDITERKRAEEERQRMEQQLQLAGRLAAVGELAAGVAHELNNPLAAVQAFAQFLASRDNLDETTKNDVETIYREAQRATRITTNLLRFAHRHMPEKRLIPINETLEKSLELYAYRMKLNNIEVLVELDPDLPMTMADPDQMHQVFVNIISNAEQAMTEAHSKGKLRVKTQRAGEVIRIAFADDGPGISEDNLNRIFDPFFTTKDVGKGTGLGLSICYGIVEEHGGHIYARSKPGEGATFVVELPVASDEQPVAEQASSTQGQKA